MPVHKPMPKPDTAMAAALEAKDKDPADYRLRRLAREAVEAVFKDKKNLNPEGTIVDALNRAIRQDAGLLWALFQPWWKQAIEELLRPLMAEYLEQERAAKAKPVPSGLGHTPGDDHRRSARPAPFPLASAARTVPKPGLNGASKPSVTIARPTPGPRPTVQQAMAAVSTVARLSLLDTVIINNKPIGDLTASEALGWARSRERDARFIRLLTANMPPHGVIRDYCTPEIATKYYEQASRETADA